MRHYERPEDEQSILFETSRPQRLFSEPTHLPKDGCSRKFNSYFLTLTMHCQTGLEVYDGQQMKDKEGKKVPQFWNAGPNRKVQYKF